MASGYSQRSQVYNRNGIGGGYGTYGSMGYGGYGGLGASGMGYGMGGFGTGGIMGGVMQKMTYMSMSIGLLGQGVQMLGMNAEMIKSAITSLVQMMAHSTRSLNELAGCESDQSLHPMSSLKLDPRTGQLSPKTAQELTREQREATRRRRTSRWVLGLAIAALCWWRVHLREQLARRNRAFVGQQFHSVPSYL